MGVIWKRQSGREEEEEEIVRIHLPSDSKAAFTEWRRMRRFLVRFQFPFPAPIINQNKRKLLNNWIYLPLNFLGGLSVSPASGQTTQRSSTKLRRKLRSVMNETAVSESKDDSCDWLVAKCAIMWHMYRDYGQLFTPTCVVRCHGRWFIIFTVPSCRKNLLWILRSKILRLYYH